MIREIILHWPVRLCVRRIGSNAVESNRGEENPKIQLSFLRTRSIAGQEIPCRSKELHTIVYYNRRRTNPSGP